MAPFGIQEEEEGQGIVEYGLIMALIALVALVGVMALGDGLIAMYEWIVSEFP